MNTINFELSKLIEWFQANRLSINFKKSNFMIFKPRQMRKTYDISITLSITILLIVLMKLFFWL